MANVRLSKTRPPYSDGDRGVEDGGCPISLRPSMAALSTFLSACDKRVD